MPKRKKIRIQLYSKGTDKPEVFNVPFAVVGGWLLGMAIIAGFFIFWLPDNILSLKKLKVFEIAKEQRAIQLTANRMEKQIAEANVKIESGSNLRSKANKLAGISDSRRVIPEFDDSEEGANSLERIKHALATYKALRNKLLEDSAYTNSLPLLRPVKKDRGITNKYGMVNDPLTRMELPHFGLDFAAREGDTVIAAGAGTVDKVIKRKHGFGLTVEIQHSPEVKTVYSHLQNVLVADGKPVKKGQPIAIAGRSGSVLWPVLHYELRYNNQPINPEDYFIAP